MDDPNPNDLRDLAARAKEAAESAERAVRLRLFDDAIEYAQQAEALSHRVGVAVGAHQRVRADAYSRTRPEFSLRRGLLDPDAG